MLPISNVILKNGRLSYIFSRGKVIDMIIYQKKILTTIIIQSITAVNFGES